jgi:YHS domain-containing protein
MKMPRAVWLLSLGFACVVTVMAEWPARAESVRLAIKGYDPVAYFTMGRAVQGKPEFALVVDDVRYQFATAKHLEMFRKDPDHYAPQYGGLCAMGLGAKGYKVEANPQFWVIHEGRLYLTQREFGPRGFKKDPKRWVASADAHLQQLRDLPEGSALSWW